MLVYVYTHICTQRVGAGFLARDQKNLNEQPRQRGGRRDGNLMIVPVAKASGEVEIGENRLCGSSQASSRAKEWKVQASPEREVERSRTLRG